MKDIKPPTGKTPFWDSCVLIFFVLVAVASCAVCGKCLFDLNYVQKRNVIIEDTLNTLQMENQALRGRVTDLEIQIDNLHPPPIDPATIPSFRRSSESTLMQLIEVEIGPLLSAADAPASP